MDVDKMFESRFVRGSDFNGKDWTLTIAAVRLEVLRSRYGPERERGIVTFAGARKEWVVNRTNAEALKAMWGRETDAWVGKRVTLHAVPYEGELAIRVLGSPDLERDLDVEIALPQKRPFTMRMQVTRAPAAARSVPDAERRQDDADQHPDEARERQERFGPSSPDETSQHSPPFSAGEVDRSGRRIRQDRPRPLPTIRRVGR